MFFSYSYAIFLQIFNLYTPLRIIGTSSGTLNPAVSLFSTLMTFLYSSLNSSELKWVPLYPRPHDDSSPMNNEINIRFFLIMTTFEILLLYTL